MAVEERHGGPLEGGGADPISGGLVGHFEELIAGLEQIGDPEARQVAEELVGAVVDLYGEGLRRIFDAMAEAGDELDGVRKKLSDDGVVASLMLIHDLYPVDLPTRVDEALAKVRPYMESHGGNVEMLSLTDGVARIRLEGSCKGCAASSATLELAIKQALMDAAPDLEGLEVEGAVEPVAAPEVGGLELPIVQVTEGNGSAPAPDPSAPLEVAPLLADGSAVPAWLGLDAAGRLADGQLAAFEAAGRTLAVARIDGSLLAYANRCPGCGGAIVDGRLIGDSLACPGCGVRFDLPAAGRAMGGEPLQLEPVPLLEDDGGVRVAVAR
jgi:Fe-S cluster biogenesis protein NfuA/nitrite reductase/ring-hydroxylating ferredoxin subunit